MMAALLMIIVLDVFVPFTLWYLFRADNAKDAINAFYFRMCHRAVFIVANIFCSSAFVKKMYMG